MSEHTCNSCEKNFTSKHGLEYHLANNACKINNYMCKFCQKGFTTETNMYRHVRTSCKIKKKEENEKNLIYERLIQLEEESRKFKKIAEDNKKLKKEVSVMKKKIKISTNINNGSITNNNTYNVNNIVNPNVILVAYGKEDFTKLDQKEILKALHNGYNSTIKLTEIMHFNPKYPEHHNIYISNMKDKYAMMYDGRSWTLTMKEDLINKIYDDKKNYIEENLDDFIESLSISRKKALERWLDIDDDDKKIKEIKDNIKLLLYNSRNMPIVTTEGINLKIEPKKKTLKSIKDIE